MKTILKNGAIEYRNEDGEFHREDGPAIIFRDIYIAWYKNGKLHREDGPAEIELNGAKVWYSEGKIHKEDGPAVIYPNNGEKYWFINGEQYDKTDPIFDEAREKYPERFI